MVNKAKMAAVDSVSCVGIMVFKNYKLKQEFILNIYFFNLHFYYTDATGTY